MTRHVRRRLHSAIQRAMPLFALAGFLAGTVGVPVPQPVFTGKDRSRPFPCMDRKCGCASADQCWRGCCCFTNREKVAWAKEHSVTPPEFVVKFAAREKPPAATVGCCAARESESCGAPPMPENDESATAATDSATSLSIELVTAIQARQCQGQAPMWLAMGAATPPPAKLSLNLRSVECGVANSVSAVVVGISSSPATPPPRA